MKSLKYLVLLAILPCCLTSCHRQQSHLLGEWATTDTYDSGTPLGFQLSQGGLAASINQPTVQYAQWSLRRHDLVLSGKRFEERTVVPFNDTLHLVKSTDNDLWLSLGAEQQHYKRVQPPSSRN